MSSGSRARARLLASYLVWPAMVVATLAAVDWGVGVGISIPVWAFVVSTATFVAVVGLERLMPVVPGVSLFRDSQTANDIGHGILVGGLGRPLAEPLTLALAGVFVAVGHDARAAGPWPHHWPMAGQVALGLLIWSLPSYWTHRWFHRVGRLWWFHALHHDPMRMQVLKGNRIHLGEDVMRYVVMLTPLLVLGASPRVVFWIAMWNNVEGALAHSNVDVRFPSWAHYVVPTPQNHRVHHAANRELQDANFAGVTPLWDIVFGTYRHPDRHPVEAFGLGGTTVPPGFLAQLGLPLRAHPDAALVAV